MGAGIVAEGELASRIAELLPTMREIRHDFHAHPELGFAERRTQREVCRWLEQLAVEPRPVAGTGVIVDLRPDLHDRGVTVGLRADLDALPIAETTELPYRSVHEGVAHKCGHDGHTAILIGTVALLAGLRHELTGNVRCIFQPAEEGLGGARRVIEDGALEGVDEIYGLHSWPGFPKGEVRVAAGVAMAATHTLSLTLRGRGGHGSTPEACRDPIVAAANIVSALQTVVSRGIGHEGGAVVSIGSLHAGTTHNVIPDTAHLLGTIRTFSDAATERVLSRIREVVAGISQAMGVSAELTLEAGYPCLQNHPECVAAVERVASATLDPALVSAAGLPLAAAEDFAYYTQRIPGAYFFLGAGIAGRDTPGCHHPDFDFDDDLLGTGVDLFTRIVLDRLASAGSTS